MAELINFSRIVDSDVQTGIITLNENNENLKDRIVKVNLKINEFNANNGVLETKSLNMISDYSTIVNLNYKMKSACHQIEESIKMIQNK